MDLHTLHHHMHLLQTSTGVDEQAKTAIVLGMNAADITQLSDEQLLEHSLGSPAAFEVLMVRYQREFLARAQAVVKSRDDAEDIVQETFVRVYRFAPKFAAAHGTFRSWSLTILMNVARTRYQKKVKERGTFAVLEDAHYESLADPVDTHGDFLNKDEVAAALAKVDGDTARILTLAYLEDLPYQQIAEMEGTTVGAIKARVHRAKAAVRAALQTGSNLTPESQV